MASYPDMKRMTLDEIMEFNAAIDFHIELREKQADAERKKSASNNRRKR